MRCFTKFTAALVLACATWTVAASPASAARPDLYDYSSQDQQALCSMILDYLTEAEIHWHMVIDHNDSQSFFHGHRAYIQRLEHFLLQQPGGDRFVPLPKWNPRRPIPPAFRQVQSGYDALQNLQVNMPIPNTFQGQRLGQFRSMQSLYDALNPYHNQVHDRVGGCMGDAMTAPAAPIFFCWHAALDDVFQDWANVTGYEIPTSFDDEFPAEGHGDHAGGGATGGHTGHTTGDPATGGHGGHTGGPATGGHGGHTPDNGGDHGCICGPKCGCGPGCKCPKRPGWKPGKGYEEGGFKKECSRAIKFPPVRVPATPPVIDVYRPDAPGGYAEKCKQQRPQYEPHYEPQRVPQKPRYDGGWPYDKLHNQYPTRPPVEKYRKPDCQKGGGY